MADADNKRNALVDDMPRDSRGFWQPERGTAPPSPLFTWPPNPVAVLKWLFGIPGYLFPWNLFYMALATVFTRSRRALLPTGPFTMRGVSRRLDPADVRSQSGDARAYRRRLASLAVVAQGLGDEFQIHDGLVGDGESQISLGKPASRQHFLELRQRGNDLDGLRGPHDVGLR